MSFRLEKLSGMMASVVNAHVKARDDLTRRFFEEARDKRMHQRGASRSEKRCRKGQSKQHVLEECLINCGGM